MLKRIGLRGLEDIKNPYSLTDTNVVDKIMDTITCNPFIRVSEYSISCTTQKANTTTDTSATGE